MTPGTVYRHDRFYADQATGEVQRKFFVALARIRGGDLVARLLTSRAIGRPQEPRCFHGNPYPGFFLGVIGGPLGANSWADLRQMDDLDANDFEALSREGIIGPVANLNQQLFLDLLDCVAQSDNTTRQQEDAVRNELARRR